MTQKKITMKLTSQLTLAKRCQGFTYVEILVSISLLVVLAFILDVLLINTVLQRKTNFKALAHQLAQEELEVLKSYPFDKLTPITNGAFRGILYNRGTLSITTSSIAVSGTQIIDMVSIATSATTTAHLVLPKNAYSDATISAQLHFFSDSPNPFGGGIFFRALDSDNGYLVTLSSTNDIFLDVIENGNRTNIINQLYTVVTDVWYELELTLSGDTISLDINGIPIFSTTDTTFSDGFTAIVATDNTHVGVDDITTVDTASEMWNFDNEPLGTLEGEWRRPGLSDLPSSTAKLTIIDYLGSDKIKQVTTQLEWFDKNIMSFVEETTLINNQ